MLWLANPDHCDHTRSIWRCCAGAGIEGELGFYFLYTGYINYQIKDVLFLSKHLGMEGKFDQKFLRIFYVMKPRAHKSFLSFKEFLRN